MHCCSFLASLMPSRMASSPDFPIASHARLHDMQEWLGRLAVPHQVGSQQPTSSTENRLLQGLAHTSREMVPGSNRAGLVSVSCARC